MADVITVALSRQVPGSGQILPIEAATGTGKTLAYLVPCALHAARARERMLVSTQTIALGNQIMAREGPIAQEVVALMMGHRPRIAHIRGRRHFLSPSRTRAVANLMEDNGVGRAALEPYRVAAEHAEEAMAAASRALEEDGDEPGMQRLIEACLIDHIEEALGLKLDREETCLLSTSPASEKAIHELSRKLASSAEMLVATHAYSALSLARNQLFGSEQTGFNSLVIDEADQWAASATAVSLMRVSISGVRRSIDAVAVASTRLRNAKQISAASKAAMATLEQLAAMAPTTAGSTMLIEAEHPAFRGLRRLTRQMELIMRETVGVQSRLAAAADRMAEEVEALKRLDNAVSGKNTAYWTGRWTVSRVTAAATIEVVGHMPGRIMKRVWDRPDDGEPFAKTIILTSATLATPGFAADSRWRSIEIATGIDPTSADVLADLATTIEPGQFGSLRFRFADPRAPVPWVGREGKIDDAALEYAATVIRTAHIDVGPKGRTLVLVPAYEDVDRLAPLVPGCMPHRQGTPLSDMLASYAAMPRACLITPAAWVGADLPGMVQALVIPRLPYAPPEQDNVRMVGVIADMLVKLAQGIGRAIRRPEDHATIWFADPRMPIPECVTAETGMLPSPHANPVALGAIPARFREQFGRVPGIAAIGVPAGDGQPARDRSRMQKSQRRKTTAKRDLESRRGVRANSV